MTAALGEIMRDACYKRNFELMEQFCLVEATRLLAEERFMRKWVPKHRHV